MKNGAIILIVDDQEVNRELLEALLVGEGYQTMSAESGEEAIAKVAANPPDLILLDVMMSGMDGYQVASTLKGKSATQNIPIIMVTSLSDRNSRMLGLNAGAEEFLMKPVDRAELGIRVRNMLRLKEYSDFLGNYNLHLEVEVQERTLQLRESNIETIFVMTRAAEHKDEDTGAHVRRISHYCKHLADYMGLGNEFVESIFYASPMHDIGKIAIPDHILLKPGRHTTEEFEIMKTHSALGASILREAKSPFLLMGGEIAQSHHERWDGTGYPAGLKGEMIPLSARIMMICDVYDALRSKRPYKPAFEHERSVEIITKGDGRTEPGHFDPEVLSAFGENHDAFNGIFSSLAD